MVTDIEKAKDLDRQLRESFPMVDGLKGESTRCKDCGKHWWSEWGHCYRTPECFAKQQLITREYFEDGVFGIYKDNCVYCHKPIYLMDWLDRKRSCLHGQCEAPARLKRKKRKREKERIKSLTCQQCGESFDAARRTAKYCSALCRVTANRAKKAKI
jgi:hypothetical protein